MVVVFLFATNTYSYKENKIKRETLTVAGSKAWKPFSYLSDTGKPQGILIDLWRDFGRRKGYTIEFLLTDWENSIEIVRSGRADVHSGLISSDERSNVLEVGAPIFAIDVYLFFHQTMNGTPAESVLDVDRDYEVGVVAGGYEEEFMSKNYPHVELRTFTSSQNLVDAVLENDIKIFITDLQVVNYSLYDSEARPTFYPVKKLYRETLHVGLKKGRSEQANTVDYSFPWLDETFKIKLLNRWVYYDVETVYPSYLLPASVVIFALLIISYILLLRRTVKKKTHALQVANFMLQEQVVRDSLTGLHNRRYFYQYLDSLGQGGTALMIFDVDNFKQFNDTYGHEYGDEVLRFIAKMVKKILPNGAIFCRIGGEEFAILQSFPTSCDAMIQAENIRSEIEENTFRYFKKLSSPITISLGLAYYIGSMHHKSIIDADRAMYEAKSQGKNRVVCVVFD
ncbi:hypothetical protein BZG09_16970 [Salinivibrio kushneri]|uniref:diguanylate cyclase n=2 Tax=Salinivibrio kushneri TaxID=1908198 RepID=A0AB36JW06_9GAMM|nr:hypothetical protein BZG09_16970 [Salinivibrio kushneri]